MLSVLELQKNNSLLQFQGKDAHLAEPLQGPGDAGRLLQLRHT